MKISLKLLLVALFGFLLVAQAFAKDSTGEENESGSHTEGSEDHEEHRKLNVEFSASDAKLQIESESESSSNKDKFELEVETGSSRSHPKIRVKYYSSTGDSGARFDYRVLFLNLIEFVDNDGAGYSENSTVKQVYDLGKNGWVATQSVVSDNTSTVYTYTFSERSAGAFSFDVVISGASFTTQGISLTPDQVKISVLIENFNWLCSGTDKCSLALSAYVQTGLRSRKEKEHDDGSDNQVVLETDNGEVGGYFQWLNNVELLNGNTAAVKTSSLAPTQIDSGDDDHSNMGVQKLFFTFSQTSGQARIYWDPIIGVGATSTSGAAAVAVSVFSVVLALIALLL